MNLVHLWRRYVGRCRHEGFFAYGDNEMKCTWCGYTEKLR